MLIQFKLAGHKRRLQFAAGQWCLSSYGKLSERQPNRCACQRCCERTAWAPFRKISEDLALKILDRPEVREAVKRNPEFDMWVNSLALLGFRQLTDVLLRIEANRPLLLEVTPARHGVDKRIIAKRSTVKPQPVFPDI